MTTAKLKTDVLADFERVLYTRAGAGPSGSGYDPELLSGRYVAAKALGQE